jgi:hypothetical protein
MQKRPVDAVHASVDAMQRYFDDFEKTFQRIHERYDSVGFVFQKFSRHPVRDLEEIDISPIT